MLLLVIAVILFILADITIRMVMNKVRRQRELRAREEALATSLRLDFTREARTLKRAEVPEPRARILCVDDEDVVLDSFRRIMVMDGYNVDTVQTGQEALGLIQSHHYDFVFTDLKMPEMDGHDVVKSVKHLRPDIDVIVITGYGTVESAVECMQHGAMNYIQKPFTDEELLGLVQKSLLQRQERIRRQLKPQVFITEFPGAEQFRTQEFAIPGGIFVAANHCWVSLNAEGHVSVGIDDFAKKLIGKIESIEFPNLGMSVQAGQTLFTVRQSGRTVTFASPVSGKVLRINQVLAREPARLDVTPYDNNWVCELDPDHIDTELTQLKIGRAAVDFYQDEIARVQSLLKDIHPSEDNGSDKLHVGELEQLNEKEWTIVTDKFFVR